MNRKKPEQIEKLLRKADEELVKGKVVEDFCREEPQLHIIAGNASMATCK